MIDKIKYDTILQMKIEKIIKVMASYGFCLYNIDISRDYDSALIIRD